MVFICVVSYCTQFGEICVQQVVSKQKLVSVVGDENELKSFVRGQQVI